MERLMSLVFIWCLDGGGGGEKQGTSQFFYVFLCDEHWLLSRIFFFLTAHKMKELNFLKKNVLYCFLKQKPMIPDACRFLKIELRTAAMKDFSCFSESLCDSGGLKGNWKKMKTGK